MKFRHGRIWELKSHEVRLQIQRPVHSQMPQTHRCMAGYVRTLEGVFKKLATHKESRIE